MRHPVLHEEPAAPGAPVDRSPGAGDDVDHVEPRPDADPRADVRYGSTSRSKPGLVQGGDAAADPASRNPAP